MNDLPEEEARALLAEPLYCHEIEDWSDWKLQPGTVQASMGLVDHKGRGVRMQVALWYRKGAKTNLTHHVFTVFKQEPHGLERVYQLEIRQWGKALQDTHQMPHEHWGNARVVGTESWANWSYDQVLAYFCQQTKIVFEPPPEHPEYFALK